MTNFPAALDTPQNPGPGTSEDAPGLEHDVQHANANDAIKALQAKVGINGSLDTASLDYLVNKLLGVIFNGNANYRFKDGQLQMWDQGYADADATHPWAALTANNGSLGLSDPIAD